MCVNGELGFIVCINSELGSNMCANRSLGFKPCVNGALGLIISGFKIGGSGDGGDGLMVAVGVVDWCWWLTGGGDW